MQLQELKGPQRLFLLYLELHPRDCSSQTGIWEGQMDVKWGKQGTNEL